MSYFRGPQMVRDGLVMQLDAANPKSFRGNTTNLSESINKVYGNWGTNTGYSEYFLAPNNSNGVHLNIADYTDGGVNYYGSNFISVVANTQYTKSAIYKADLIPSPNMFYVRQYNNTWVQQTEYGVYDSSRLISLGNDWYLAWSTFTTTASSEFVILQGYEYKVNNIWVYDLRLEQNGNTIYDLSKNNNYGTLINGVLYDSDNCGSLKFDATNAYINVNNLSSITNGTISFWSKMDDTSNWLFMSGQSEGYYILATSGLGNFYHYNIGNNTLINYVDGLVNNTPPSDLGWHYITLTGVNLSTWTVLYIGIYNYIDATAWKYNGKMSNIMFYDRVLSQSEIQHNYNATKGRFGI